jgi:hypothetical protein
LQQGSVVHAEIASLCEKIVCFLVLRVTNFGDFHNFSYLLVVSNSTLELFQELNVPISDCRSLGRRSMMFHLLLQVCPE